MNEDECTARECEVAWRIYENGEDGCCEPFFASGYRWPGLTLRKAHLFAAACCRRIWKYIPDGEPKRLIEAMERADEGMTAEWEIASRFYGNPIGSTRAEKAALSAVAACCRLESPNDLLPTVADFSRLAVKVSGEGRGALHEWETAQQRLLFELLGDSPNSPVVFFSSWRPDTTVALARQMYESRCFDAMPVLADALQDAGCDSKAILNHCRDSQQTHIRGCWVVDLVLGKG